MEGINYYPKRRKKRLKIKFIVLVVITLLVIFGWFWVQQKPEKPKGVSTRIVISTGKKETLKAVSYIEIDKSRAFEFKPEVEIINGRGLDEVIKKYNQRK
jgi:hypothetical protein